MRAALELFCERDFDQVSIEELVGRAGVSRGALYHHFTSKRDLFRAVWKESEVRAIARIASAAQAAGGGPFDQLIAGSRAYLNEAASSRELQRIGLRQSRVVLGWDGWRRAAGELGIGLMEAGVAAAMEAGEMEPGDVAITANVLLAAQIDAALLVASAQDPKAAVASVEPVVVRLLEGLRAR